MKRQEKTIKIKLLTHPVLSKNIKQIIFQNCQRITKLVVLFMINYNLSLVLTRMNEWIVYFPEH